MKEQLFKEVIVWKQENENTLYRYRGLQNLETGKYCFFHCDPIHKHDYNNVAIQKHQEFAFRQNLFAGGLEFSDDEMFDSIEDAIADILGE
jgi:hypothetical protein